MADILRKSSSTCLCRSSAALFAAAASSAAPQATSDFAAGKANWAGLKGVSGDGVDVPDGGLELARFGEGAIQMIIMGDINVHEISWLKYLDGSTLEGR